MRIKFKTIIRSTDKESATLIDKIFMELDKPGYRISAQTPTMVIFKYSVWRLASRGEVFRRIDGGLFHIVSKTKTITFSYYVSPMVEIIGACFTAYFGFTKDYHIFFLIIFIAVTFVCRAVSVRTTAIQMMDDILAPE